MQLQNKFINRLLFIRLLKNHFPTPSRNLPSRPAAITLALSLLALTSCSGGTPPESSFEYAVQGLYSAELSDDGSRAIVGSINHGGSLWQVSEKERQFNWNHKQGTYSQIISSAFSPDLGFAITATPQTMVLWDANSGEGISYWTAPSEILDINLLPQGELALLGMVDHSAALFDVRNGGVRQVFYHDGRVNAVAIDSAHGRVLTGSDDYSARLWDLQSAKELQRWEHEDEVQLVELSPDGRVAFTMAKYDKAALWDTETGASKGEIPLFSTAIARGLVFTAVAFSDDANYLLTGTSNRIVQLWDTRNLKEIKKWIMPKRDAVAPTSAAVQALAFAGGSNSSGNYYAITSDGFTHRLR